MLSLEQAVEKTLASVARLEPEFVVLNEAYRRYAAQNLHANVSLPGFDNSAMDGYAVISSDLKGASEKTPNSLHNIGVVPAGDGPDKKITPGCCMRIFTGSPIPEGANAVVMQEVMDVLTAWVAPFRSASCFSVAVWLFPSTLPIVPCASVLQVL